MSRFQRVLLAAFLPLIIFALALFASHAHAQQEFRILPDSSNAYSSMLLPMSSYTNAAVLVANTNATQTVPAGALYVRFAAPGCTSGFYLKRNAAAAIPASNVTDGSSSEANPAGATLYSTATFGLISSVGCVVTMSYYVKQ